MEIPFPYYFLIVLGQKDREMLQDWECVIELQKRSAKNPFIKENSQYDFSTCGKTSLSWPFTKSFVLLLTLINEKLSNFSKVKA